MPTDPNRPVSRVKTTLHCELLVPEVELDESYLITAELMWSTAIPELVTAAISSGGTVVDWDLSRELLTTGCRGPAGLGDVSVIPRPDRPHMAELVLFNGESQVALVFEIAALEHFLAIVNAQTCPNGCWRENRGDGRFVCISHEVSDIPPAERFLNQP